MSITAGTVWEVQVTGDDTNGGGFNPARGGTDYTYGTSAAVLARSDLTITALAAPAAPTAVATSGGSIAAGTYYVKVTYYNSISTLETTASSGTTVTTDTTNKTIVVTSPAPTEGADQYKVYMGTVAGSEKQVYILGTNIGTNYTQTSTPGGSTPYPATATLNYFTSAGTPFQNDEAGNIIQITSGSGFTTGFFEIIQVTASRRAILDKNPGTAGSVAGVGKVGGALATPGMAATGVQAGNGPQYVWIKSGSFTCSSTANGSGGRMNLSISVNLRGYQTTRGDGAPTRPVLQPGTNNVTVYTNSAGSLVDSLSVTNPGNYTTCTGFAINGSKSVARNCTANNLSYGFAGSGSYARFERCSATNCGYGFQPQGSDTLIGCYAGGCSNGGYSAIGTITTYINCIAYNCNGGGFSIFYTNIGILLNCSVHTTGNGFSAFYISEYSTIAGCISWNSGKYGVEMASGIGGNNPDTTIANCALGGSRTSDLDPAIGSNTAVSGTVSLSSDPFVNAAGGNFALNTTIGGGASCLASGYPASFAGISTPSYPDIGAAQHQEATALYYAS